VPEDATVTVENDGTMIVITLASEPATDILIGLFPLDEGVTVNYDVVLERLEYFVEQCIREFEYVSYERAAEVDDLNLVVWQAVVHIAGERWWLARIYGRLGGSQILLVHWNGPAELMTDVVLKSFVSLDAELIV
jgi:hypothetical protein